MAWSPTSPATLVALRAAWAEALPGVDVVDGPEPGTGKPEAVTVGYTDEDTPAVEATLDIEGAAVAPSRERYTVHCEAAVLNGAKDIVAARTRAYELLAAAAGVLAADKTLGGLVMDAHVGEYTLRQIQDSRGALANIVFGVVVDAFTNR